MGWAGCDLASRHTHRHDHNRPDLVGMYPDLLRRHAHEPIISVWAGTNQENNKTHYGGHEKWRTWTTPRATAQKISGPRGIDGSIQTHTNTIPHQRNQRASQPQTQTHIPTGSTAPTAEVGQPRIQQTGGGQPTM